LFHFEHSYRNLPAALWAAVAPTPVAAPDLLLFNQPLAVQLGLADLTPAVALAVFSGNQIAQGSKPLAQAYAGHQFGHAARLGDGRAVLLGEQLTPDHKRVDIQLKGAGRTPFSRGGDGRAALAPMLREYLISEALHALGVPCTRILAVVKTGEQVLREEPLPGAIAVRVAASHLRVGTFQYAAWHEDNSLLPALLNYAIARHYPELNSTSNPALAFLQAVMQAQIALVVHWQRVGFVHGVLNTDNVTISAEAIDFGPCAFMEQYDEATVFSSIDRRGRYAFGAQPSITLWNLSRLAEALLPVIDPNPEQAVHLATQVLEGFNPAFNRAWLAMMRGKLGLLSEQPQDAQLVEDWLAQLQQAQLDYTNAHLQLMSLDLPNEAAWQRPELKAWHARWRVRVGNDRPQALTLMSQHNPWVIPRNHLVEQALNSAQEQGDMQPFHALLKELQTPYLLRDLAQKYCTPARSHERVTQTFCGT
jgi:uncharacterized protein YdiU (UPF0061 family)